MLTKFARRPKKGKSAEFTVSSDAELTQAAENLCPILAPHRPLLANDYGGSAMGQVKSAAWGQISVGAYSSSVCWFIKIPSGITQAPHYRGSKVIDRQ
ncbi:hypothetical protein [Polaromonas sp.]|uniref:hypothetical protein n=1 Tax=Polaromonas sp. TaxID=1869339 RepID=UPI003568E4E8